MTTPTIKPEPAVPHVHTPVPPHVPVEAGDFAYDNGGEGYDVGAFAPVNTPSNAPEQE